MTSLHGAYGHEMAEARIAELRRYADQRRLVREARQATAGRSSGGHEEEGRVIERKGGLLGIAVRTVRRTWHTA